MVDNALSSIQAMKQKPVLSVRVLRKLFGLWDQNISTCKKLKEIPRNLTTYIGDLVEGISLNYQDPMGVNTEFSRWVIML